MQNLVSIILPTFNDEKTVKSTLESLVRLSYEPKEILVVDDGSTDETLKTIEAYKKQGLIQATETPHHGRSHARNLGFKNARGPIVFFAESDAIYDPDYLTKTVSHLTDPRVGGVLSMGDILNPKSLVEKCMDVEMRIRNARALANKLKPISAWVYRADALKRAGGFDERLEVAEDQDLAIRVRDLGYEIVYEPTVNWWHPAPRSLLDLISRSARHGRKRIPFCIKHPRKTPFTYLGLTLLFLVLLALWLISPVFPILALATLAATVGVEAFRTRREGWEITKERRYLTILPLLGFTRSLSFTVGFIVGAISFPFSRR
jgi:cellulose synthase/poly-beta-1,6-N-acetylglucosamine synthase-like glycosyltransferase